jgi:Putative lipoprotein LpqV
MRRYPDLAVRCGAAAGAAVLAAATGCSAADRSNDAAELSPSGSVTTSISTSELPPLPAQPTPPDAVGVSPGGVTTRVDVPADATESQYGQACRAAKLWLDAQQGDPLTLVEAYLRELQAPGAVGPGSFDVAWTELTPAQQAGAIMAVNGAANDECG